MPRIITKKAYEFVSEGKTGDGSRVRTVPFVVSDVPEWVTKTDLFALAKKGGNAEVMGGKPAEKPSEKLNEKPAAPK